MPSFLTRVADRSIATRINLGFGLVLLLLCGIAAFDGLSLNSVGGTVSEIDTAAASSDALSDFANGALDGELQVTRYLRSPGGAELVAVRRAQTSLRERLARVETLIGADAAALKTEIAASEASFDGVVADTRQRESALNGVVATAARLTNYTNTFTTQMAASADPSSDAALRLQQAVQSAVASVRRYAARPNGGELDILSTETDRVRRGVQDLKANPPAGVAERELAVASFGFIDRLLGGVDAVAVAARAFEKDAAGWRTASGQVAAAAAALRARMLDLRNAKLRSAKETVGSILLAAGVVSVLALILGSAAALWLGRSIARPLLTLDRSVQAIALGNLDVTVEGGTRRDEIGALARALEVFKANAIARLDLEGQQAVEQSARQRRADRVDELVRGFQQTIAGSLQVVTSAATELDATARAMTGLADSTNNQAVASSAAAEETSANVQTVAAAAEQMVSSLQEIERQVMRSNAVASAAAREAQATDTAMAGLNSAAEQIGEAASIISNIAGQTNLLALNATIEAARAGEAGRGFAVVAAEVKELANQTARATENIGGQIAAIQAATRQAAAAMRHIGQTIVSVNEITATIAATVMEQTAATSEIARNASEAAHGTQDVSANIALVLASADETGGAAAQVLGAAAELATQSLTVKLEVDRFLGEIQAA